MLKLNYIIEKTLIVLGVIQIQHLLKLNSGTVGSATFSIANSNTTLVKVKYTTSIPFQ